MLAALQWAALLSPPPRHLAIHTDSSTSFGIFNSLCVLNLYNLIILGAIKIRIEHNIDLCVFLIEGKKNMVADALSQRLVSLAWQISPSLTIHNFAPMLNLKGSGKK